VPAPATTEDRPTRERILAAALHLVQTEGLQALTQGRAATAAGLRQSHLTYYFPTRKDLIKALAEALHGQLQAMHAPITGDDARPTIKEVREFFAKLPRDSLLSRLMLALVATTDEDPSLRSWLVNFENQILTRLRALFLRLGLEPSEEELELFHATLVGASIMALHGNPTSAARSSRVICLGFDRLVRASTTHKRTKVRSPRHLTAST
jgi:AcrR family transcriptional regulator